MLIDNTGKDGIVIGIRNLTAGVYKIGNCDGAGKSQLSECVMYVPPTSMLSFNNDVPTTPINGNFYNHRHIIEPNGAFRTPFVHESWDRTPFTRIANSMNFVIPGSAG